MYRSVHGREETHSRCREVAVSGGSSAVTNFNVVASFQSSISDIGVMTLPGIKQEPLSPGDRMMPSCSHELVDLEEVLYKPDS